MNFEYLYLELSSKCFQNWIEYWSEKLESKWSNSLINHLKKKINEQKPFFNYFVFHLNQNGK